MHPPMFRLQQRLSDWPDCHLELRCEGCRGRVTVPSVKLLLGQLGDVTFDDLVPRLRCQHCRNKPASIYLCASQHRTFLGGPRPDWAVELVPPPRAAS